MSTQSIPCPPADSTLSSAAFTLLARILHTEELGVYRSYGLQIRFPDGTQLCFDDLSPDCCSVQRLVELCNSLQPDPIHLNDILEDFLSDPDAFFS